MNVIKRIGLRMVKKRKKVAIFVDWENVRKEIKNIPDERYKDKIYFNFNNVDSVERLIKKAVREGNEQIDKIYFYTAEPLSLENEMSYGEENKKKKIEEYKENNKEQYEKAENGFKIAKNNIEFYKKKDFVVRLGKTKLQGFHCKIGYKIRQEEEKEKFYKESPNIKQKQVDILLAIDIANVIHKRKVKKFIIFSKDTDMIPAIEYAKRNKIEVVLVHIVEGHKIPNEFENAKYELREISLAKEFPYVAR